MFNDLHKRFLLCLAVILPLLVFFPLILPEYFVILITQSLIYAIAALSLDLLLGYVGLAAIGHMVYFAIGAYITGILTVRYHFGFASTLFFSIAGCALAGAIIGLLALRARDVYFLMITLSIALCGWGLATRWVSLTGGYNGVVGIPRPNLGEVWNVHAVIPFYYLILIFFSVCLLFFYLLVRSPFGKSLVGIRDSESRMRVLGYNTWLHKYIAFIIAAAIAGLAGNLYAYYNGYVSPDASTLQHCLKVALMVGLGGPGTIVGPIIGAFILTFIENILSIYTDRWVMGIALVYFLTAMYTPEGILGLLSRFRKQEEMEATA
jgi:branched-chain amino acid transport system permease protein